MKVISWNYIGVGSKIKEEAMLDLISPHQPDICLIQETKMEEAAFLQVSKKFWKTKGRKSRKEEREQATYKDKLQGSQLTLEKLLKNPRNTRQHGHAPKGMPTATKSK